MGILDAPGYSRTQANAAFQQRNRNTVIPIGTSFTEGNYGPGTVNPLRYQDRGWFVWCQAFLGQRLTWTRNAGVSGDTTTGMLARIDADVIAYNPGWCVIEVGPNDGTTNISAATTQANIQAMADKLLKAGIRVAVTTPVTTNAQTTPQKNAVLTVGTWLRGWARSQPGIILIDFAQVYTDPLDGNISNFLTDDGTHPSADGAKRLGQLAANALAPFIPNINDLPSANVDTSNLLTNGMMYGNSSGAATGIGVNGSGSSPVHALSKVGRTDLFAGGPVHPCEWQRMAVGPGNGAQRIINWATITTGFAIGDTVQALVEWRMQASPTPVAIGGGLPSINIKLIAVGGSAEATWCYHTSTDKVWTVFPTPELVALTPPITVPSGTTSLVLQLLVNGLDTITVDAGRAKVFKVA